VSAGVQKPLNFPLNAQDYGERTPRPIISGVYHDQWRKTHTGWRLAHRAAHVDGDPGLSK